jgi:hypothetical protein
MNNELTLRDIAVQMFKDLYLAIVKGKYGECYYIKGLGGKGAFLQIDIAEKVLSKIPLPLLSVDNVYKEYKRIIKRKKEYFVSE